MSSGAVVASPRVAGWGRAPGRAEVISKTIDELVEPDVLIHMPLPIQATGA
jgi:hypothetical protein